MWPLSTWTERNHPIMAHVASEQIEHQSQRNKSGHLNFTNLNGWHKKVNVMAHMWDIQLHPKTPSKQDIDIERTKYGDRQLSQDKKNLVLNWKKNKKPKMNGGERPRRKPREKRECRTINSTKNRTWARAKYVQPNHNSKKRVNLPLNPPDSPAASYHPPTHPPPLPRAAYGAWHGSAACDCRGHPSDVTHGEEKRFPTVGWQWDAEPAFG